MYRVTSWHLVTYNFSGELTFDGLVYTMGVVQSKINQAAEWTLEIRHIYRDHEPLPHMTYTKV